jgi:hypothetical protein
MTDAITRAEAALSSMRLEEIETAEAQLTVCLKIAQPENLKHLARLRLLALQSAQLWRAMLPRDNSVVSYSADGSANLPVRGTELSITG